MITLTKEIYKDFLRFVIEHSHPESDDWKEVIGIIVGKKKNHHDLEILEIVPMNEGSATFVDIQNYEQLTNIIPMESIANGTIIIGWAHSHPGYDVFMSVEDLQTQKIYQRLFPQAIALVIDPTKITPTYPGFKIFQVTGKDEYKSLKFRFDEKFNFAEIKQEIVASLSTVPKNKKRKFEVSSKEKYLAIVTLHGDVNKKSTEPFNLLLNIEFDEKKKTNTWKLVFEVVTSSKIRLIDPQGSNFFSYVVDRPGTIAKLVFKPVSKGETMIVVRNIRLIIDNTVGKRTVYFKDLICKIDFDQ